MSIYHNFKKQTQLTHFSIGHIKFCPRDLKFSMEIPFMDLNSTSYQLSSVSTITNRKVFQCCGSVYFFSSSTRSDFKCLTFFSISHTKVKLQSISIKRLECMRCDYLCRAVNLKLITFSIPL